MPEAKPDLTPHYHRPSAEELLEQSRKEVERHRKEQVSFQKERELELAGREAIRARTFKPLMPSVFAGWRKSLYEGTQTRLETERGELETMLKGKLAEIEHRKKDNVAARMQANVEVREQAVNISVLQAKLESNALLLPEDEAKLPEEEEVIEEYKELLEIAKELLKEAEDKLERAKIVMEVEQEDLSKEERWAKLAYGEDINSHRQREAHLVIDLWWMTDRRWPRHLLRDPQAVRALGGLIKGREQIVGEHLPEYYYTQEGVSRMAPIPPETPPRERAAAAVIPEAAQQLQAEAARQAAEKQRLEQEKRALSVKEGQRVWVETTGEENKTLWQFDLWKVTSIEPDYPSKDKKDINWMAIVQVEQSDGTKLKKKVAIDQLKKWAKEKSTRIDTDEAKKKVEEEATEQAKAGPATVPPEGETIPAAAPTAGEQAPKPQEEPEEKKKAETAPAVPFQIGDVVYTGTGGSGGWEKWTIEEINLNEKGIRKIVLTRTDSAGQKKTSTRTEDYLRKLQEEYAVENPPTRGEPAVTPPPAAPEAVKTAEKEELIIEEPAQKNTIEQAEVAQIKPATPEAPKQPETTEEEKTNPFQWGDEVWVKDKHGKFLSTPRKISFTTPSTVYLYDEAEKRTMDRRVDPDTLQRWQEEHELIESVQAELEREEADAEAKKGAEEKKIETPEEKAELKYKEGDHVKILFEDEKTYADCMISKIYKDETGTWQVELYQADDPNQEIVTGLYEALLIHQKGFAEIEEKKKQSPPEI